MPMSEREIIAGARARAAALCGRCGAGDRFAVGLEGGLDRLASGELTAYVLKSWACVTDGTRWSYGAGGAIMLPPDVAARVVAGDELGDVIDAIAGGPVRGTRGAWGVLTRDVIGRRDAFELAVLSAFAPFYNSELYGTVE
jgi:non-canonical (house-cleaning) NTP pyrophosphatase